MATDKITESLERHPTGLSISEISRDTGLHRNNISPKLDKMLKDGLVKVKMVGMAKVYYLQYHHSLHGGLKMEKGKNIHVGIGVSKNEDSYKAAMEAAQEAVQKSGEPTFSIVFFSSKHDPYQIAKGIDRILGAKNWIGCSTDRELNSKTEYTIGSVEVLCLNTKYMHFSVAVAENYRADPFEKGREAILNATQMMKSDRLTDPYVQYARHTKKSFTDIVRTPPYFILTFIGGTKYDGQTPVPGMELEFLEGVFDMVGPNIPVLGASTASDMDKLMQGIGQNYQIVNGKVYNDAAIVAFVISDLYFSYGLEHGFKSTKNMVLLSKVTGGNRIIEELNSQGAVDEYCRILNLNKDEFLKNPWAHTLINPLAILDVDGRRYIKTTGVTPDGKSLYALSKLVEDTSANILSYDETSVINALSDAVSQAKRDYDDKKISFILVFSCCGRRTLLGDKANKELEKIKEIHGDIPFIGFHAFGEIGAMRNKPTQYNNLTGTVLVVFDNLLTE